MAVQKQDDQHEHTFSSYVRIRDVVLKTCLGRWTIGRSGERGSGISVLPAWRDDDDDDDLIHFFRFHLDCSPFLFLSDDKIVFFHSNAPNLLFVHALALCCLVMYSFGFQNLVVYNRLDCSWLWILGVSDIVLLFCSLFVFGVFLEFQDQKTNHSLLLS